MTCKECGRPTEDGKTFCSNSCMNNYACDHEYSCPGCSQEAFHKHCPAHGTYFYMSGVPYTPEIDAVRKRYGVEATDALYQFLQQGY